MTYSDEMLMAYVDGELDATTAASIDDAIARDPDLATRVERQRKLARTVHAAYEPIIDEPVPKRLLEAAAGAPPATSAAQAPRRWSWLEWGAVAASLVLGITIGASLPGRGSRDSAEIVAERGQLVAHGALARALSEQLSSTQKPDSPIRIGLTFASKGGEYCRTFAVARSATAGLACADVMGWRVDVLAPAASAGEPSQYRTAAGELPPAVLRSIEERMQGTSLDAAAERVAQQRGWRR